MNYSLLTWVDYLLMSAIKIVWALMTSVPVGETHGRRHRMYGVDCTGKNARYG